MKVKALYDYMKFLVKEGHGEEKVRMNCTGKDFEFSFTLGSFYASQSMADGKLDIECYVYKVKESKNDR